LPECGLAGAYSRKNGLEQEKSFPAVFGKGLFMNYDTLAVGKRIQELCKERGLTQEQLAERLSWLFSGYSDRLCRVFQCQPGLSGAWKGLGQRGTGAAGCCYPNPDGTKERDVTGLNKTSGWYSCAIRT